MILLRSILFNLCFYVTTFFFAVVILLAWPVAPLSFRQRLGRYWSIVNRHLLAWICRLHVEVHGAESLPTPPFVILAKHQSAWETVVFPGIFPRFVWVLKRLLLYIPFFGWALKAMGEIAIDRANGTDALRLLKRFGSQHLAQGTCVVVFPEGTRVAPGARGTYNPGGVMLALDAGVPIVPVAHNGGEFWGKRSFLKRPGTIHVHIAPPIPTQGLSRSARKELNQQVEETIEGMMAHIARGHTP